MALGDSDLPIIGLPKIDENDRTRVIKFGKMTGVLFPEVYVKFVSTLHREHPDLIAAMQLAQVSLQDGTAIGFLREVLALTPEQLSANMPMEVGYSILLDAINKRSASRIVSETIAKEAGYVLEDKITSGAYREKELAGTPLFPSFDELKDREEFNNKKNWKDS